MTAPNLAGYKAYQKNKYQTASPHRLTLMLYNGAIQFAGNAIQAMQQSNITDANKYIQKTQDIVYELLTSLNTKQGGQLAENLKNLYLYIIDRLVEANIKKEEEPLHEVIKIISEIRASWEEIGRRGTLG